MGLELPQFKTGKYSKSLPSRLSQSYQASLRDDDLLGQREEIALVDARIGDVLSRVDTGESGAMWRAAQDAFEEFKAATLEPNAERRQFRTTLAIRSLDQILSQGTADTLAWNELFGLVERRRRLVQSERKYVQEKKLNLAMDEVLAFAGAVLASVKNNVSSPEERALVAADVQRFCMEQNRQLNGGPAGPEVG